MSARITILFLCVFAAGFDMKRRVASRVVGSPPAFTRDDVAGIPVGPIVPRSTRFVRLVAQFCLPKKLRHHATSRLTRAPLMPFFFDRDSRENCFSTRRRILRG